MFSRKADGPLTVQIPGMEEDRPSWTRVGVIAAIGFIVGVGWPRLAGVRLGPSIPETTASTASAASAGLASSEPPAASSAPTLPAPVAALAAPALSPTPAIAAPPSVTVGRGVVFACKTSDGDSLKGTDCGVLPGLDGLIQPRLRKLVECPEAAEASGKFHLVFHFDFPRGGVSVDLGRGHGVSSPDALLACAKTDLSGLALTGVVHENPRYSVAYTITFGGAAAGAPSASASTPAHSGGDTEGAAQIVWEVAIVRDAPKTGKVVARLQRGAELQIGAPKDGWYPAKFGAGFASDGWIYRGAIGK